jgi:GT2 family glycosyltransferase
MKFSVIIPVWNGSDVLTECLNAVLEHSDSSQIEVICVDNASTDGSVALLREFFPQIKLLTQPVNLGFAGGVNAGMEAAHGEFLVLLNQDCVVASGWLEGLSATFAANQACGIAGAVIEDADGVLNHAGALITQPLGYGRHLLQTPANDAPVDYVTGAIYAIRRSVREQIGSLDEDFYPAYYEESDYCYRARRHGIETYLSVDTRGRHLFSSREWKRDPIRHTANHHQSRYRFVCKQFSDFELAEFVRAEACAVVVETSFHESLGRVLASSHTLDHLDEILQRRIDDGNAPLAPAIRRLLLVGLTDIYQSALQRSEQLALPQVGENQTPACFEEWQAQLGIVHQQIKQIHTAVAGQRNLLDDLYLVMTGRERGAPPDSSLRGALRQARGIASGQQSEYLSNLQQQLTQYEELFQSLDHRMNLIETQVTLQEYRRMVRDQLFVYAYR